MSCNLQKVVDAAYDLLKKVPNASADIASTLKLIEDKKKVLTALTSKEKLLQQGMKNMTKVRQANMNMLAKAVQQKKADDLKQLKDSTELQMLTTGVSVDSMPTEYYAMMQKLVDTVVKPGYVNKPEAMFLRAMEGKVLAGSYNTATNMVQTSDLTEAEITEQAKTLTIEWLAEQLVSEESSDEVYVSMVEAIKNDTDVMNMLADDISERAADMIAMYAQIKGSHALYHELVRAGAARFMRTNPEDVLTREMHELYKVALSKSSEIASLMEVNEHDKNSMYWTINVDEFVAEALTNPLLIKALTKIKVDEARPLRRNNSVFGKILDVALEMLGISNTDNLYAEVLSTYTQILEAQIAAPVDSKSLNKEYAQKIADLVKGINDLVVTEDGELILKNISYGIEKYVAGQYDPVKNEIKVAIVPSMESAIKAATGQADAIYYQFIEEKNVKDEDLQEYMKKDPVYKKLQDAVPEAAKELIATATEILNTEGVHALTHEYIHAGAAVFMKKHPEHAASKRIKDVFEKVKHKRHAYKFGRAGVDEYWMTSVDEFLAEALSNPKMMVALSDIKLTYDGALSSALQVVVAAAMKLLGFKQNGSAYEAVLDSFAAIVEAQQTQSTLDTKMHISKKSLHSVGVLEVFSKEEKRHFANPLMRALIKDLKPRIVEKDISANVLITAIKDNVANMILGKNITLTMDAIDRMYVSGAYDSITNTLYHPGRKVDVTDDVLNSALDNSVQKLVDALPELDKEEVKALAEPEWSRAVARAVLNRHRELKKSTTGRIPIEVLLHELGHALTENFIAVNPDHEVVLELSSIFEHVKPLLMKDSYFAETDTYWQQDMEEFLSEALSNPRLIKKLASMPVHDVTDINSVLEAIVKFVSKLFGKAEHTMYDAIMYRLAQIAEYGDNTESAKALLIAAKEGNKMNADMLIDRLGSIQSPKAKEIILELTKDCR